MVQFWDSIPPHLSAWALAQPLFFVSSAPLSASGHVNVSPKGLPSTTFSVFDPNHAAYVDSTGSGCETISHVYENGRVTVMFCSFDKTPRIMRWFCRGSVVEYDQPEFGRLLEKMGLEDFDGARAVIMLEVYKVQTSCGYAVPRLALKSVPSSTEAGSGLDSPPASSSDEQEPFLETRDTLTKLHHRYVVENKLHGYQMANNCRSLDGLLGLRAARREKGEWIWAQETLARAEKVIVAQRHGFIVGLVLGMVIVALAGSTSPRWTGLLEKKPWSQAQ